MDDDVLAMQGARASAAMIFSILIGINSVPARKGLSSEASYPSLVTFLRLRHKDVKFFQLL